MEDNLMEKLNEKIKQIPKLKEILEEISNIKLSPQIQTKIVICTQDYDKLENRTHECILR